MLKPNPTFSAQKVTIIDRLIIKLGNANQPSLCMLQEQLPLIFRITNIKSTIIEDGTYETTAQIYHEKAVLDVQWNSAFMDTRLSIGQLVSARWKGKLTINTGHIIISRLVPIVSAQSHINLLDTIPNEWCKDRSLVSRAAKVVELFSVHYRNVFNTIFWDSKKLYSLVSNSSFINTIENCEQVMKLHYKNYFDIEQAAILLLMNTSAKNLMYEAILEKMADVKKIPHDDFKNEYWASLLMALDYE